MHFIVLKSAAILPEFSHFVFKITADTMIPKSAYTVNQSFRFGRHFLCSNLTRYETHRKVQISRYSSTYSAECLIILHARFMYKKQYCLPTLPPPWFPTDRVCSLFVRSRLDKFQPDRRDSLQK